ncbi:MAG: hypothetical protein DHS20C17_07430 [Cyclobacteriaceae bacterium]|nr:MAG: hypothetical protein DHS20C17_07430 [Cyclobacteriaceae bacterium]
MRFAGFLAYLFFTTSLCFSQVGEFVGDEKNFYAATKQVNQFLKRFNGEENLQGRRYSSRDPNYRNANLRRKYLRILFDDKQKDISAETKEMFMNEVIEGNDPQFLDLHGGSWFAQVTTRFNHQGKDQRLQLFLRLQEEPVGSKWVIYQAYFDPFNEYFDVDTADKKKFIHPMSHELDFMNLRKIFDHPEIAAAYTNRSFKPDYLSLVLYEIKRGNLKFTNVDKVRFHFFQLDNWYFELTEFNRSGPNTGWLISNLLKTDEAQKEQLREHIYYEGN